MAWYAVVATWQIPGETVTIGRDGILTGVEASVWSPAADPSSWLVLTVSRAGQDLASASIASSAISTDAPMVPDAIGQGFFDLSSACIPVTVGDVLTLTFTTRSPDSGFEIGLGFDTSDDYAGGHLVVNGNPINNYDAAFKTFVR